MEPLSPIFKPLDPVKKNPSKPVQSPNAVNPASKKTTITTPKSINEKKVSDIQLEPFKGANRRSEPRKERSDKRKNIKFPVSPKQRLELRTMAKNSPVAQKGKKNETTSNTYILTQALTQQQLYPEHFPKLIYKDTGQYMNVKPTLREYEKIEELAFKWNCSRREAVYRLIMNHIFVCEVDYNATEWKT